MELSRQFFKILSSRCSHKLTLKRVKFKHLNLIHSCYLHHKEAAESMSSTPILEMVKKYPEINTYEDMYKFSLEQSDAFWSTIAKERLLWRKEFSVTSQHEFEKGIFRWFPDGELNVAENCVDRHAERYPDRVALLWEKDEPGHEERITYKQLKHLVDRLGNVLRDSGVCKGDRVAIYLPVSPVAVASMLACARIGAVHTVVFAGFSAEALASRINGAQANTVITADETIRGGKKIELKKIVEEALKKCPCVSKVFVASHTGASVNMGPKDIDLDKCIAGASPDCPAESQNSEDLLFLLYTSGSTGKPKGIAHSTAGYLLYAAFTHKQVFNYHPGDIFGCVADIGWVTGHTYGVYGALANGGTTLLFESTPVYPDPGRYWEMVERLRLTQFYCAPTALRLLLRHGDTFPQKYDLSSLRVLGSVGEPLNHEAWVWYHEVIGKKKCPIVDTWWQTETGGVMISPRPSAPQAEILPGMPMRPFYGVNPVLIDRSGLVVPGGEGQGALCIESIWPGIARTIYGDHQRYLDTYFKPYPGYFFTGDSAHRDLNNYIQISGRMDDVINVTGHRLGTFEVEDVLDDHVCTAECAVVGFPHELKGESIYAFVVLKENVPETENEIREELKSKVRSVIAAYAVPDIILTVPGLPKTRSGKIMRRILRKIANNEESDFGDISTLANPNVVQEIVDLHKTQMWLHKNN